MLKPALLYAQEITRKFTEHLYTTDYFYYSQHVVTKRDIDCAPTIIEAEVSEE